MKKRQSRRWPPRRRPRKVKRFKPNLRYLHEAEEAFILADIRSFGDGDGTTYVTAADLERKFPNRYDPAILPRVMKRMSVAPFGTGPRKLESRRKTAGFGRGAMMYRLPQPKAMRRAA